MYIRDGRRRFVKEEERKKKEIVRANERRYPSIEDDDDNEEDDDKARRARKGTKKGEDRVFFGILVRSVGLAWPGARATAGQSPSTFVAARVASWPSSLLSGSSLLYRTHQQTPLLLDSSNEIFHVVYTIIYLPTYIRSNRKGIRSLLIILIKSSYYRC